jgi:hypothetical protein
LRFSLPILVAGWEFILSKSDNESSAYLIDLPPMPSGFPVTGTAVTLRLRISNLSSLSKLPSYQAYRRNHFCAGRFLSTENLKKNGVGYGFDG